MEIMRSCVGVFFVDARAPPVAFFALKQLEDRARAIFKGNISAARLQAKVTQSHIEV
jgi:hypothetical protein